MSPAIAVACQNVQEPVRAGLYIPQPPELVLKHLLKGYRHAVMRVDIYHVQVCPPEGSNKVLAEQCGGLVSVVELGARRRPRVVSGMQDWPPQVRGRLVPHDGGPAIVDTLLYQIDLIVGVAPFPRGSVLGRYQVPRHVPVYPLRIPVSQRPDHRVGKRVVRRNGPVPVHSEDLACQRGEVLRQRRLAGVPGGDVQLSVRPELYPAAVMVGRSGDSFHKHHVLGDFPVDELIADHLVEYI